MKFSKVVFVNYFHNGDLHVSRGFVRAIMKKFPSLSYAYSHTCNKEILKDIPGLGFVPKAKLPKLPTGYGSAIVGNTLYLNTWYGAYKSKHNGSTGIAFDALYGVFNHHLTHFNTTMAEVEPDPKKLFPTIDFSKLKTDHIKKFIDTSKETYKKHILISNGNALSGQAANFPFAPVINALVKLCPKHMFIYTNADPKIKKAPNVRFSGDIIGKKGGDLNENGYLSTLCDVIVGRTSGVYTFSMIQDNMFERDNLKMISFSNIGDDSGNYWLAHKFRGKIKYSAKVVNFKARKPDEVQRILKKLI